MHIHLGERKTISSNRLVGIFNRLTLIKSEENKWLTDQVDETKKTVAVDIDNRIIATKVAPVTVIKRDSIEDEYLWRLKND